MREIGGYFGLEEFRGKEYYEELVPVNNARNALVYVIRAKGIKKLYIPYYLCDSIAHVCEKEGVQCEYYHVGTNFLPIFDLELQEDEYLYIVNYFGQVTCEKELVRLYGNIIFDNVQAFFQSPCKGIDTLYSCRKFFGVPDGGYVSTNVFIERPQLDVSMDRMDHILGRFEGNSASDYYPAFQTNDESFSSIGLRSMSRLTHNILRAVDYQFVRERRESNFSYLCVRLKAANRLQIQACAGPFAYPFYCTNGSEIRKRLAERKIYVPTLWPEVISKCDGVERDYALNILPLPCDQRYDSKDMERIVGVLLRELEHPKSLGKDEAFAVTGDIL